MRLKLEEQRQERIENVFQVLIIIAALATLPLTAAYWFEWEHWTIVVGDWVVWSVFVAEYAFFLAVSTNRWQTTKNMWLSVGIILFSFPLLHELLKTTRLIRLVRPVPLLRQSMVLRQIQFFRLSNIRSAGSQVGWTMAKQSLGEGHRVVRWMIGLERLKDSLIQRLWAGRDSSGAEDRSERQRADETD